MCAISGIFLRPAAARHIDFAKKISRMLTVQAHRGPDSTGAWYSPDGRIGLGHNRLAIIDLSDAGRQPMLSSDARYALVFNGEIYNYRSLRQELEKAGARFRTRTDSEILIESYRFWGEEMLQRLRGMFSFAIYDTKTGLLFCARDRVGKKPFVYAQTADALVFASEIPAVLQVPGIDLAIDHDSLAAMMLYNLRHIPDPNTVYRGIRRLRAGHAMTAEQGKITRIWRYWQPVATATDSSAELRAALDDAVAVRTIADVPVGALLSGGIDSTAIVSLMQQHTGEEVRTYAFGADKDDEDLRRARLAAKKLGTSHKEFYFDPARQLEVFNQLLQCYGEPLMLLPLIHTYQLSRAVKDDGIKVVLNGNGADELFYGYTGHIRTARVTRIVNLIGWLGRLLPEITHPAAAILFSPPGKRKAAFYRYEAQKCWPGIFRQESTASLENIVSREMTAWGALVPHRDFIDESNFLALLIENTHSLTIASDLPAMMASVEMRAPFLDQKIVSMAMGIHFSRKVKGPGDGSRLKYILRKAVSDLVPQELLDAPKRGFGMGIQEKDVLLGPWRKQADAIFDAFPELGPFEPSKIKALWENAKSGHSSNWNLLSKMFSIGLWSRLH